MIGIGWSPLQEIIGIENMLAGLESFLHISKTEDCLAVYSPLMAN